jgi:hypothetical protein
VKGLKTFKKEKNNILFPPDVMLETLPTLKEQPMTETKDDDDNTGRHTDTQTHRHTDTQKP